MKTIPLLAHKKAVLLEVFKLQRKTFLYGVAILFILFEPACVFAATLGVGGGTGGSEFQPLYNFIYTAGTGYLGRSISLIGGLVGLGIGAATGKGLPAVIGVFLAIFGVLGPTIVNALFTSAII